MKVKVHQNTVITKRISLSRRELLQLVQDSTDEVIPEGAVVKMFPDVSMFVEWKA